MEEKLTDGEERNKQLMCFNNSPACVTRTCKCMIVKVRFKADVAVWRGVLIQHELELIALLIDAFCNVCKLSNEVFFFFLKNVYPDCMFPKQLF